MTHRNALPVALAALALVAVLAAGCGSSDGCPASAALADNEWVPPDGCTVSGPTVTIPVRLCEQCSHTNPSCTAEVISAPSNMTPGEIFLSTEWHLCEENRSCSGEACGTVTCAVTVPMAGTYDVSYLNYLNTTDAFTVEVVSGSGSGTCG